MSAADVNTKVALAVAAQESGDFATALSYLRSAAILLAGMPDSTGPGGSGLQYDRPAIQAMMKELQKMQAAADSDATSSGGIRRAKITYVNPDEDTDY